MNGRFQIPGMGGIRQDPSPLSNYVAKAFDAVGQAIQNHSDQGNIDPNTSQVAAPAQVGGVSVVEQNGIHDIQIQDNSPAYQGIQYSAFYSTNPDMSNAHRIDLGESQNHRANMGAGTYYWGATSKYSASQHSPMVFHGGSTPVAVGSGQLAGPSLQAAQGFNTQYRNSTTPPVRS